AKGAC
ncbi:hypothetical protein D049_2247B, partial [Vibrio parahaemolyticus VPTS-2010]